MALATNNNVAFNGVFTCMSKKPEVVKKFIQLAKGPNKEFAHSFDTRIHTVLGSTNIGTRSTYHDNVFLKALKKAGFINNRDFTFVPGMTLPVKQTETFLDLQMLPNKINKVV